jgi:exonuclease III
MKIISWNCRGLRKSAAVHALLELQGRLKPDVLFLSETHLSKARAENLKRKMFFNHMIMYKSDGRSGGLLLLWRNDLNVTSNRVHNNYLVIRIDEGSDVAWRISGIYGEHRGD